MFITVEELKQTVLNANIDAEYIQPAIGEAEDVYLREILGDALYNELASQINDNALSGNYATLVNSYIKPYLTYKVQSILVVPINFKMRNAGVISQYDQGFTTSNVKDTAYLADHYNSRAEFYANRLTTYLQQNNADFPEYGYSNENVTNPVTSQNATTLYLGGTRKKCNGNGRSGGGSSSSVDWNDIRNKPDFANVATSGDYGDLQNRPEINDATLTIKQGGTVKGTFSANANENVEINLESGGSGSTDWSDITNKPDFAPVATSGNYNDLSNRPDLNDYVDVATYNQKMNDVDNALENRVTYGVYTPKIEAIDNTLADKVDTVALCTINNERLDTRANFELVRTDSIATLTIKQGGTTKGTFTPNSGTDVEIDLEAGGSGSTDWSDIQNKPNFANVATSGDYEDLANKPAIPTVPTNVSAFTNDAGYTTFDGDYNSLTNKPTIPAAQVQSDWQQNDSTQPDYIKNRPSIPSAQVQSDWNQTNTSEVDYIKNKPTIPVVPTNVSAFTNDAGYLTQHQSLAGYATENWVQQQGYSTFSGSYNDLSDKPTIPTKTSELTNDSGFTTFDGDYNSLTNKPTIPAAQVNSDWNASTGVAQILNKPTIPTKTSELTNDSGFTTFDGDYNSLTNKPTIPAAQVQTDWNANSGMGQILNKPSMTAETWTFTVDDGQGGTTTVTKTVWLQ